MNNLSNTIYAYYLSHFDEMPVDKQGHFATRLHLWCQDPATEALVAQLQPWFTSNNQPEAALQQLISDAKATAGHGSKNAGALREQYFARYPELKTYVVVLFRMTFLKNVYGIDCRDQFYKLFDQAAVQKLRSDLLADREALSILSTHAINFLYLLERVIHEDDNSLPLDLFIEVGDTAYDRAQPVHLQLLIYLYTHCIIGDTQFYYRPLPTQNRAAYTVMLQKMETLITERFNDINLDNKCEFLVCCTIAGYKTTLQERIFAEAEQSVSDQGSFLVDRHNNNPQADNISLDKSEHRNVLFIMAHRDFTPLG